jgi:hypothetical protein
MTVFVLCLNCGKRWKCWWVVYLILEKRDVIDVGLWEMLCWIHFC